MCDLASDRLRSGNTAACATTDQSAPAYLSLDRVFRATDVPMHTCFEPLLDEDVAERPMAAVVDSEWRDAAVNGVEAAVLVLAVLVWQGTPLWLVAAASAGAVVLGTLLHQFVLVVSVLGLRAWRGRSSAAS